MKNTQSKRHHALGLFDENDKLIDIQITRIDDAFKRMIDDVLLLDDIARAHETFQFENTDKTHVKLGDFYGDEDYRISLHVSMYGHYIQHIESFRFTLGKIEIKGSEEVFRQQTRFNLVDNFASSDITECLRLYNNYKHGEIRNAIQ